MRVNAKPAGERRGAGAAARQSAGAATAAALPRRRGAAAGRNGRNRRDGSKVAAAAEKNEVAASAPMYDSSDSFENHVIDLRGDRYRSANVRDEDELTLRDTQSSEEVSVDRREESDSDMDAIRPNGHAPLSNGKIDEQHDGAKGDDSAEEGTNNGGPSSPLEHQFVPGQLTWAKFARFPWWPAQVMDERERKEGRGGTPASDTDLLVRFFGTYDYGWVDPFVNLSDFDVKLAERSRIRKKALQKGVEEALAFRTSGKLPEKWEAGQKTDEVKKSQNGHSNGATASPEEPKASSAAHDQEPKERKTPRKRKPKVLFEEEGRLERKPQRMLRRLRVMRQLGLVAPAGSPFTADYS